ncbi:MAG: cupin domain-containing protein [Myxococcota bacterium]|jgi:quercetin dioxygenase-like cupin family protein|nr:cupin domain-containing protein [Myxococcota bacterium]
MDRSAEDTQSTPEHTQQIETGSRQTPLRAQSQVPLQSVAAGRATQFQVLIGPEQGSEHFSMRRFVIGAGGSIPLHRNRVEHVQYVLRGSANVQIGENRYTAEAGSALFIPAGIAHAYEVLDAPYEFLCTVPNTADELSFVHEEPGETGQVPNRQELAAMNGEESCKPEGLRAGCEQQPSRNPR